MCGDPALEQRRGEFRFTPPPNIPGGVIVVGDAVWRECGNCHEKILPRELDKAIDAEAARREYLGQLNDPLQEGQCNE